MLIMMYKQDDGLGLASWYFDVTKPMKTQACSLFYIYSSNEISALHDQVIISANLSFIITPPIDKDWFEINIRRKVVLLGLTEFIIAPLLVSHFWSFVVFFQYSFEIINVGYIMRSLTYIHIYLSVCVYRISIFINICVIV